MVILVWMLINVILSCKYLLCVHFGPDSYKQTKMRIAFHCFTMIQLVSFWLKIYFANGLNYLAMGLVWDAVNKTGMFYD